MQKRRRRNTLYSRCEHNTSCIAIALWKQPWHTISISERQVNKIQWLELSSPTIENDKNLLMVCFDESARVKRKGVAYSTIVWKLTKWTIIKTASEYATGLNVNEAKYQGLQLGFDLLVDQTRMRIIICGVSNLLIRQMCGKIVVSSRPVW